VSIFILFFLAYPRNLIYGWNIELMKLLVVTIAKV